MKTKYNMELTHFEMNAVYMKAILKCKDWHKERKWLIKNNIDPTKFVEEKKF